MHFEKMSAHSSFSIRTFSRSRFAFALRQASLDVSLKWGAFAFIIFAAVISKMASSGIKLAFFKDWLVVLSERVSDQLTTLNTSMRRIDLLCSILAPMFIGLISSVSSSSIALFVLAAWSTLSLLLETQLATRTHAAVPALQAAKVPAAPAASDAESSASAELAPVAAMAASSSPEESKPEILPSAEASESANVPARPAESGVRDFLTAWRRYVAHPTFLASFAYSLLYLNLLNLGGNMSSYLKVALGLSDLVLAIVRGVAALVGVLATVAVPRMVADLGLRRAALVSVWLQCACLVLVLVAFLALGASGSSGSFGAGTITMLIGLCSSRFGLWAFDLTQSQIMQESVAESEAGVVNGTQESLINVMYLGSFALTAIWPDATPAVFFWPVVISYASVVVASLQFSVWYARQPADVIAAANDTSSAAPAKDADSASSAV